MFEFCNSCATYTEHKQTAPGVIRCTVCGHGKWAVTEEKEETEWLITEKHPCGCTTVVDNNGTIAGIHLCESHLWWCIPGILRR